MALTKTNTRNPIQGVVVPNNAQRTDCQAVIAQLVFADLGRGAGTLHTSGAARLDMQGRTAAGDANIQVQIGGGSVAAISVLNQSMDSGTVWNLTGTLP